jgi:hypothetical protein
LVPVRFSRDHTDERHSVGRYERRTPFVWVACSPYSRRQRRCSAPMAPAILPGYLAMGVAELFTPKFVNRLRVSYVE